MTKSYRVKLSKEGLRHFKHDKKYNAETRGTMFVSDFGRPANYAKVLRDGLKTPYFYHISFWEKVKP